MSPAIILPLLLSASTLFVHVESRDVTSFSPHHLIVMNQAKGSIYSLPSLKKTAGITAALSSLGNSYTSTNAFLSDSHLLLSGLHDVKGKKEGFAAIFLKEKRQSIWSTGNKTPVASWMANGMVTMALIHGSPGKHATLYLTTFDQEGHKLQDEIPPVDYRDLDPHLLLLSLPHYRIIPNEAGGIIFIDPYTSTLYFLNQGKSRELKIKVKRTQLLPLASMTALSSYVTCDKHTFVILLGVRSTKKIVPYLVEITKTGTMIGNAPMDNFPVYSLFRDKDHLFGRVFDPSKREFGIQPISCNDLIHYLAKQ